MSSGNTQEIGPRNPNRNKFTASEPRNEERNQDFEDLQPNADRTGVREPFLLRPFSLHITDAYAVFQYGTPVSAQVRDAASGQVKHEGMEPRDFPSDKVVDPVQTIHEGTRVTYTYVVSL